MGQNASTTTMNHNKHLLYVTGLRLDVMIRVLVAAKKNIKNAAVNNRCHFHNNFKDKEVSAP
jgi:hypothetical protein